jgi:DNA-binding MarR family transcriptional regulator
LLRDTSDDQVLDDLLRASRIFVAIAANSLANDESQQLSMQQYRALALVASQESQRPADLARSLGVTPSTTTALCDRLVQKGLISRENGTDRRSLSLAVSPGGREQLENIAARRGDLLQRILDCLPDPARAQLAEALVAFIDAAGEAQIDEWSIRGL